MWDVKIMEKFNYYFNTKSRIDAVLSEPVTKANINSILFNLIWNAYYNISTDESVIVDYVVDWMNENTKIFHLSAYAKTIKGYIKKVKKMPWRDIQDTVKVRKSELDYIASFNDIKKEKILFCYFCVNVFVTGINNPDVTQTMKCVPQSTKTKDTQNIKY